MRVLCRIVGVILILLGVGTAVKSFLEYGVYLYTPMEIIGEYFVYALLIAVGVVLVVISSAKIRMPNLSFASNNKISEVVGRGNNKQKIVVGAAIISLLMILFPPKQKITSTGKVLDQFYGWIFSSSYYSKGVINIPLLSLQLVVVAAIALALLYAFKETE